MRNPVMQASVGKLDDLHGILLVWVMLPQTLAARALLMGMIGMVFMGFPLGDKNGEIGQGKHSEHSGDSAGA